MRKRFNKVAVCSSENYAASKRAYVAMLKAAHEVFKEPVCSSKEVPSELSLKNRKLRLSSTVFVTISVFGKPLKVTKAEYEMHCKDFKIIYNY